MTTHASTSVLDSLNRPTRREKVFGAGRPKPLSRHEKVNLMREARRKRHERSTELGEHITRADVDVFYALLWDFHNAVTGLCFPSYEAIAKAAGCARSTVYEAIKRLEAANLLTWVNRIKRRYETVLDMFGEGVHGQRSRVERTSNGYQFIVPPDVESSKSENSSGTEDQESFSSLATAVPAPNPAKIRLDASRKWLEERNRTGASRAGLYF
jgi:AraC-like DNA-binding protein